MILTQLKLNKANPRFIRDDKFHKLVNSIREFPKMMYHIAKHIKESILEKQRQNSDAKA